MAKRDNQTVAIMQIETRAIYLFDSLREVLFAMTLLAMSNVQSFPDC